jgi:hypothetical protein
MTRVEIGERFVEALAAKDTATLTGPLLGGRVA